MLLEIAYNFNSKEPEILRLKNPPAKIFESRERFIAFIGQGIDVLDVWNASCCIYTDEGEEYSPPAWYEECNGKIFFEPLQKDEFAIRWELTREKAIAPN